jgi:hypothetical protein
VTRTSTIPRVEPTDCSQCLAFHREASTKLRERDLALEQAFDAAQVAEIEQEFDRSYIAIFRAWMDHKSTHETGSLREYVAQFRQQQTTT